MKVSRQNQETSFYEVELREKIRQEILQGFGNKRSNEHASIRVETTGSFKKVPSSFLVGDENDSVVCSLKSEVASDGLLNSPRPEEDNQVEPKKDERSFIARRARIKSFLALTSSRGKKILPLEGADVVGDIVTGASAGTRALREGASIIKSKKVIVICLAAIVVHLMLGVLIGMKFESWDFVDSLYFSVTTLTTVGYGDLKPQTDGAKIAISFYIVIGIALITAALGIVGEYIMDALDGDENEIITNEKRMLKLTAQRKKILFSIFSMLGIFLIGLLFFIYVEGFSFANSFYLVVATLSTVGYGEISPTSRTARIFAIFWILCGNLIVARGIGIFLDYYLEKKQAELRRRILTKKMNISDLRLADEDNSGTITQSEYILFKIEQMGLVSCHNLQEIALQFQELDVDNSGYLTREEALASPT